MTNSKTQALIPAATAAKARFWQMNIFIILAAGCNFINLLFYEADNMTTSAIVEGTGILILTFFLICNIKGIIYLPKILSIVFVNLHSLVLCYIQGTHQGAYLYLFPFVMAMIFFLRVRKNDWVVTAFILFTTTNLLIISFGCPYQSSIEPVPANIAINHLLLNVIVNFLLVVAFFYFVLQLLDGKERRNKNEQRFADAILNTSLDAVFVVDPLTLTIHQYNDKAAELFALDPANKKRSTYIADNVLGKKIAEQIALIRQQDGSSRWQGDCSFSISPMRHFHGFVSIVSFEYSDHPFVKISILDITTLKMAEFETLQAKEKAEKAAAAKARFMSNMSHELRTPLNAIIGTTHLLMQEHEALQETEHFKVLQSSSEHMLQLVNEVLDFSKLDEGKLEFIHEAFDLMPTLKEAADSFSAAVRQKSIDLHLEADHIPEDFKVVGDQMRLRQVLLNLLSNAVKFTDKGSVILNVSINKMTSADAELYFAVTDTGIGISPEKCEVIFDSFTQADAETTRKYGGSGLGLSICKQLVRNMGGQLRINSEPGKGSCFYFTLLLPLPRRKATFAPKEKLQGLQKLTGIKILLAEDNVVNRRIATRFLDSWEAITDIAENGEIAWQLFQKNNYHLLLIDLEMPQMDGKQFLAHVRNVDREIPAIAFTAAVYENMYDDLKEHGFNSYLHKPFRPDEMHRNILQHLMTKPTTD